MKNTKVEKIGYLSASVGPLGESKNSRSHFKLILYCFLPNIRPQTKFNQDQMKNIGVEKLCYCFALEGQLSWSNTFYVVLYPMLPGNIVTPITNLTQIG